MKSDTAIECFLSGFNCAQAVFSTYCDDLGLEKEMAKRIDCIRENSASNP